MGISETVQIISSIIGIVVSITAVVISVLSLKQTHRSIDEANRPYVVIYKDYIQVLGNVVEYMIVKNFGKSGATIDSLDFEPVYNETRGNITFENINDTFIAPGQTISTVTSHNAFAKERKGTTKATIKYHTEDKKYEEEIILNEELEHDIVFSKTSPAKSATSEEVIAKAVQEILRRGL